MDLPTFYDQFCNFILDYVPTQEMLKYQIAAPIENRVEELRIFEGSGTITPEERDELRRYKEFSLMVSVLKAKALARADS